MSIELKQCEPAGRFIDCTTTIYISKNQMSSLLNAMRDDKSVSLRLPYKSLIGENGRNVLKVNIVTDGTQGRQLLKAQANKKGTILKLSKTDIRKLIESNKNQSILLSGSGCSKCKRGGCNKCGKGIGCLNKCPVKEKPLKMTKNNCINCPEPHFIRKPIGRGGTPLYPDGKGILLNQIPASGAKKNKII